MMVWYSQYYDHIVRRKPREEERRVEISEEKSAPTKRWLFIMIPWGWSWIDVKIMKYEIGDNVKNNISGGSLHLEADRTATALNQLHTGHTSFHHHHHHHFCQTNHHLIHFDSDFWRGGEALEEEEVCGNNEQKFSPEIAKRGLDEESRC